MLRLTGRRKKAARKRKTEKGLLIRALPWPTAALVLIGLYVVFFTGVFSVQEVRLLGGGNFPVDSLKTVTAGIMGSNLLTVSLEKIRKQFLGFPQVRDVEFRRKPFHRIDCYVIEREPVAVVAAGGIYEVDADGVVIHGRYNTCGDIDLPIITGVPAREFGTPEGEKDLKAAVEVLQLLKSFGFSPAEQLSEIHCERDEIILVWMKTGTLVRMGEGDYEGKVRKFKAVYGSLEENGSFPELIDLRFDRQVVVR